MLHHQRCPNEQHFIQPITRESLFAVGVHREIEKPLHPPWGQLLGVLFFFLTCVSLTFWLIAYSHARFITAHKEALLEGKKERPY